MESEMWKAFMENQKFTDKEASDIEIAKQQFQHDRMKDAYQQLGRSQNISDYTYIAGKITEEDINETPESHPKLKDYDHSLERVRTVDDMIAPEPEPEGLRLCPRGLPEIEMDDVSEEDIPDFGINWDSIGKQLGL